MGTPSIQPGNADEVTVDDLAASPKIRLGHERPNRGPAVEPHLIVHRVPQVPVAVGQGEGELPIGGTQ